jgi:signal transduction histidine kinase
MLLARRHIPSMARLSDDEIIDDLPEALKAIAEALSDGQAANEHLGLIGGTHGLTRFHQGVSVAEFALEYPLLRQALVGWLRQELGRDLRADEADGLHTLVDRLIQLSGVAFTTLQEKEIRLENEATGRHLAMMSHDLRNTLNAAMLSMQMVRERLRQLEPTGPPDLPELLTDMDDCRRMAMGAVESMTRVLEAERLRVGRVPLSFQPVELCSLLKSVRTASMRANGQQFLGDGDRADGLSQIDIDCEDGLIVRTDPDLLSTILQNLIGNAIRYAGHAPIRLVARRTSAGCTVLVDDQGPGIEPEQLRSIFGLFRRGTQSVAIQSTRGEYAGSGLGLFIARRAAELLGARLDVQSTVGKGSTFALSLPSQPAEPFDGPGE